MQKIPNRAPALAPDNAPEMDNLLARQLHDNWIWVLVRGLMALLFGILALLSPMIAALSLVLIFGAYALADGIFAIVSIFTGRRGALPWWALLVEGIFGIAAGAIAFFSPGVAWLSLVWVMGGWLIASGVVEIITAVRLMHDIDDEWWMIFSGVISIVAGALLFVRPLAGGVAVVWVLALYAILFGAVLTAFALRLRRWQPSTPTAPPSVPPSEPMAGAPA